jgi:hypothetical protein
MSLGNAFSWTKNSYEFKRQAYFRCAPTAAVVLQQFAVVDGAWHFVLADADELDVLVVFFKGGFHPVHRHAVHDHELGPHVVHLLRVNG